MASDLLENFHAKNLYFQNQFSQCHISLYGGYVADCVKRPGQLPWHISTPPFYNVLSVLRTFVMFLHF